MGYLYLTLLARQGTANRKRSLIFATALFQLGLYSGLSSIPVMPVVLSNGDTKTAGSKQRQHTSLLSTRPQLQSFQFCTKRPQTGQS